MCAEELTDDATLIQVKRVLLDVNTVPYIPELFSAQNPPEPRCLDPLCSSCTACLRRASSAPALTRSHSSPEPRAPARPHPACLHSGRSPSNRAAWALTAQRPRLALPTTPCTAARACPDLPLPAGARLAQRHSLCFTRRNRLRQPSSAGPPTPAARPPATLTAPARQRLLPCARPAASCASHATRAEPPPARAASPLPPSSPRALRPAAPEPSRPAFAHAGARACARVGPPARHQLPAEPTPACSKQREGGGERIRERKCDCQ
ncbi:predicted GPI-anchored protein 58 [Panicum hallii]|uniref:predicted GPI-anchored protein 58 n=1 Tax=Panicum hallii TaxID=206008 RepID=UPI000DF4CC19|nr:predicted GPI-anchored protein 58 [Panicum hallii]